MTSFIALTKIRFDLLNRAAKRYGISRLAIYRRVLSLRMRKDIRLQDGLRNGLMDPQTATRDIEDGYISRMHLTSLQTKINPSHWMCLTEDKAVFFAYCQAVGLPVAPYLAIFDKNGGWSADGKSINDRSQWEEFFTCLPDEFVTKPTMGFHGDGLTVYRQRPAASELYDRLSHDDRFARFVIQPRISNHLAIRDLTGTDALQTVRIVTWLADSGDVRIYLALFKIIVGKNLHDNYNYGESGNLTANIDPNTGLLDSATISSADKVGFNLVKNHPITDRSIEHFRIPHWNEARDLVCRAARLFSPLRSIGWDVAVTQDKAFLMEGNSFWDPFNHLVIAATPQRQAQMAELMRTIKAS